MGAKIRMDQIFSKLQKIWQNRQRADGIRVEYFPRIQHVAAQWSSQKFTAQIGWNTRKFISQEEFYICRCSTTFLVEQKTMKKNVCQTFDSYLWMQEDLEKDTGHSLVLVPRRSGILWKKTVHKEFGTIYRKDVDSIRRERMSNFPFYDSIVQRSTLKQRTW